MSLLGSTPPLSVAVADHCLSHASPSSEYSVPLCVSGPHSIGGVADDGQMLSTSLPSAARSCAWRPSCMWLVGVRIEDETPERKTKADIRMAARGMRSGSSTRALTEVKSVKFAIQGGLSTCVSHIITLPTGGWLNVATASLSHLRFSTRSAVENRIEFISELPRVQRVSNNVVCCCPL